MCGWSLCPAYVRAQHSDQQMAFHPTLIQKPKLFHCVVLYAKTPTFFFVGSRGKGCEGHRHFLGKDCKRILNLLGMIHG